MGQISEREIAIIESYYNLLTKYFLESQIMIEILLNNFEEKKSYWKLLTIEIELKKKFCLFFREKNQLNKNILSKFGKLI